jgi:hypothetical protein
MVWQLPVVNLTSKSTTGWTFATEDPEVLAAVDDLALRYDFPLAWFFQSYLMSSKAPSTPDFNDAPGRDALYVKRVPTTVIRRGESPYRN